MTTAPRRRARGESCSVVAVERLLCAAWPDCTMGLSKFSISRPRPVRTISQKSSFRSTSVVNKTVVLLGARIHGLAATCPPP